MRLSVATLIALIPLSSQASDCLFGGCLRSANRAADHGRDVRLTSDGGWAPRSRRLWASGSEDQGIISSSNSDQRNGELAYQTAYDSFLAGKKSGLNKTQRVMNGGRWVRKITTGDGIVLFKDSAGNVAVQSPDGRWHVTDAQGLYASSSIDLERDAPAGSMVAEKAAEKTEDKVAEKADDKAGRSPASADAKPAEKADSEPAAPAPEAAPEAAAEKPAETPPAETASAAPAAAVPAPEAAPAVAASATTAAAPAAAAPAATTAAAPETRAPASAAAAPAATPPATAPASTAAAATASPSAATAAPAPAAAPAAK